MRSDERRFRREYEPYRDEERDRERYENRSYRLPEDRRDRDYRADRQYQNFEQSSGYNPNREFNEGYNNRRRPDTGGRFDHQDYRYSFENERAYREPDYEQVRNRQRQQPGSERDYRRARQAGTGYHGSNYENPENTDSRRTGSRDRQHESRRYQAERRRWDPDTVDQMNQYDIGMGRYQARGRTETLYGGRTEKKRTMDHNPSPEDDRGFVERNRDRVRSWFNDEERERGRDRGNDYREGYDNRYRY